MTAARVFAVGLLGAGLRAPVARADAPADATALFDQGIRDLQAGNTEVACKELAASLSRYSDSGTKGALAECYTKLGRIASAWNLWRDLADTAPNEELRHDAAANAAQLDGRLPRFVVRLSGASVAGLVVAVNGTPVADPTLSVALPIDPGPFEVHASAPGRVEWVHTFTATERGVTVVEVPALAAPEKVAPTGTTATTGTTGTTPLPPPAIDDGMATRRSRHLMGVIGVAAGVAGIVVGGVFGAAASSSWNSAKTACGGDIDHCPAGDLAKSQSDVNSAKSDALGSTLGFVIGGAVAAAGAVVYLTAPSGVKVSPEVSARSAGLVLSFGW
jgi:hypothetical protein